MTLLRVHLKFSNCDQLGKGVDVFMGHTCNKLCPISAYTPLLYCSLWPRPGPFFCFEDGSPLRKAVFVPQVQELLSQAGTNASLYAGHHSFHVRAVTSAASSAQGRPSGLHNKSFETVVYMLGLCYIITHHNSSWLSFFKLLYSRASHTK